MNLSILKVGKLEGERTEKLTEEYVDFVLAVSGEFQIIFSVKKKHSLRISNSSNHHDSPFFHDKIAHFWFTVFP